MMRIQVSMEKYNQESSPQKFHNKLFHFNRWIAIYSFISIIVIVIIIIVTFITLIIIIIIYAVMKVNEFSIYAFVSKNPPTAKKKKK